MNNINKRLSVASGLSLASIKRLHEANEKDLDMAFPLPDVPERRDRDSVVPGDVRSRIRVTIREAYISKKIPSLSWLLNELLNCEIPQGETRWRWSKSTLYRVLKRMGYTWAKRKGYYEGVRERTSVVASRSQYIRLVKQYRENGREIFYQDETWASKNMTQENVWLSDFEEGPAAMKVRGPGSRVIISHLCSTSRGPLPGALLMTRGRQGNKKNDYHSDMNAELFLSWLDTHVLPQIRGCVLALDHATYHRTITKETKKPLSNSKKEVLKEWLTERSIPFPEKAKVAELKQLCKEKGPTLEYEVEVLAKKYNVDIIWFPIAHPMLNPIEHVWARVKTAIRQQNINLSLADVERLFREEINKITPGDIAKIEREKVIPEEDRFEEQENLELLTFAADDSDVEEDSDQSDE